MAKYALSGNFTTTPENRDALVEILSSAADLMRDAEGCQLYVVCTEEADDTTVWVMEIWDSKAAHDASLTIEGVGDLIARARPMITGANQNVLTPIHGLGL